MRRIRGLHGNVSKWTLDFEAVYLNPKTGEEEFTPAQRRCATQYPDFYLQQQYPLTAQVFDILEVQGVTVENEPYWKRKERLQKLLDGIDGDTVRYVPYETDLVAAWNEAVAHNREGLIIKQRESGYEHMRSFSWLKVKNWQWRLCDVIGYTEGKNSRTPFFGALVLAYEGKYCGKVGSGFNEWELRKFKDLFKDASTQSKVYDAAVEEPYTPARLKTKVLVKYYQITEQSSVFRFPIFERST